MRPLVSYSFEAPAGDLHSGVSAASVLKQVNDWFLSKGCFSADGLSITLRDGQLGKIEKNEILSSQGILNQVSLTEPIQAGYLQTNITVAESSDVVAVAINLAAFSQMITPLFLDINCPRLVRTLLTPPSPWRYRGTPLTSVPLDFQGENGGDEFVACVWDSERSVPVVAVSDSNGAVLHPGIVEDLAEALAGLAIVCRLDPVASWRVSLVKQKEWSCFSGAIRLYWSPIESLPSPYLHPLWTPQRLLSNVYTTEEAAERIKKQLRRLILGQSTYAVSDPHCFQEIRRSHREEELSELREKALKGAKDQESAEYYYNLAHEYNQVIKNRDEEIEELKRQLRSKQYAFQWKSETHEEVEPEEDIPPSTVEEAVLSAMQRFEDELIFGGNIDEGIRSLAREAGPPYKILSYLSTLAELTQEMRKGPLGKSPNDWLNERNVTASGETRDDRNSPRSRQIRTWDNGCGQKVYFEDHLKPSDGTSPDRCVRIYYYYDSELQRTIVGWVGRHPDN